MLNGPAYAWYSIQGKVTGWAALKAALLGYLKPADYAYKTRQALAKCSQRGTVTEYIMQFSEKYTQCSDVYSTEAMFQFINGLQLSVQAWICTLQPVDLQSAM